MIGCCHGVVIGCWMKEGKEVGGCEDHRVGQLQAERQDHVEDVYDENY